MGLQLTILTTKVVAMPYLNSSGNSDPNYTFLDIYTQHEGYKLSHGQLGSWLMKGCLPDRGAGWTLSPFWLQSIHWLWRSGMYLQEAATVLVNASVVGGVRDEKRYCAAVVDIWLSTFKEKAEILYDFIGFHFPCSKPLKMCYTRPYCCTVGEVRTLSKWGFLLYSVQGSVNSKQNRTYVQTNANQTKATPS